jgi:hypothetical protein
LPSLNNKDPLCEEIVLFIGTQNDLQGAYVRSVEQNLHKEDILTMAALRVRVKRGATEFVTEVANREK